jgi:hypothetical protein
MLEFSAYLAAQHITQDATNAARPDASVRPDRMPVARRRPGVDTARQRIGLTLRRMADMLLPANSVTSAPLPASR